ncbi:DUF2512 family protein [Brevibacillus massiliensis]|jgi:uncharacterized membrane protein|uniref:DUF2512 family protein n=1 Tax=Brevibacillus massiliensis TaxID=1118054 RepID=UPI000306DA01|nr:DUF2512 family protein [Brevibacillus massiliensis]
MSGFVVKLVVALITVFLADIVLPGMYYPSMYQDVLVGLLFAVVGYVTEVMILRRDTIWLSTAMDFVIGALLIYLSQFVFIGARVTLAAALITALAIGVLEHLQHIWLVQTGRVEKDKT